MAFMRSKPGLRYPDLQFHCVLSLYGDPEIYKRTGVTPSEYMQKQLGKPG